MNTDVPRGPARISVVICVYTEERWHDIDEAVASVRAQSRPTDELIVVVDHNPRLLQRLADEFPDVMVIPNRGSQGLSGGKNTGAAEASGGIVAYLDDDAVADPGWLAAFEAAFEDPAVAGMGGYNAPMWEAGDAPAWFPDEFAWTVGCSYRGLPSRRAPIRNVMGGNSAFRRELVLETGGFLDGIGRAVGEPEARPMGGEEAEFCVRLVRTVPGSTIMYEPAARIGHKVSRERSSFAYFRARCYAEGLSKALVVEALGSADVLSTERSYSTRTLPAGVLRGLGDAVRGDRDGLRKACAIIVGFLWTAAGFARGRARRRLSRRVGGS